jgi:DNA-directed RNA polymerase specialized sigma24 family protein
MAAAITKNVAAPLFFGETMVVRNAHAIAGEAVFPRDERAGEGRFCTTQWTVVLAAGSEGPQRDAALEIFCRAYWYPLYAFLRRRGENAEDARDLVQEFFAEMLERGWLADASRRETRFSTLLLTIFQRFLASAHRRATAAKRGGGQTTLSIDMAQAEEWFGAEPVTHETPDRIFERRWALAVLEAALARLREECHTTGRGQLFAALSPFLAREASPGEYDQAAAKLRLNARGIAVAVHRLRAEFRAMVREEVAAGLREPQRVAEELRHLAQALSLA